MLVNPTTVTLLLIMSHVSDGSTTPLKSAGPRTTSVALAELTRRAPDDAGAMDDPILTAAREVLMARGPRRATLAEVARVAQVSRMTVYRRFDSLERLLAEVLTVELAQVLAQGATGDTTGTARQRCVMTIAATTHSAATNPVLQQILAVDPESLTPLMVERFGRTQRAAAQLLEPLFIEGMASRGGDGSIRDTNPTALAHGVVLSAQGWVFAAAAISQHLGEELMWQEWPAIVDGILRPTEGPDHA